MSNWDVIIVGAGACGLMAARELSRTPKKILVLEARNRVGGRIFTTTVPGFPESVEAGAEFIHGNLPLTQRLLQEAGVVSTLVAGTSYEYKHHDLHPSGEFIPDFEILLEKLEALDQDQPLADFLATQLSDPQYDDLRNAVTRFAEGYDAADTRRVSTFALREEWKSGGAATSYHPVGGYSQLINYLAAQARHQGVSVTLNAPVAAINWVPGQVTLRTATHQVFGARQVIFTLPVGVWQVAPGQPGHIRITPDLPAQRQALLQLGFGAVIKICLQFKTNFWQQAAYAQQKVKQAPGLTFLFSDEHFFTAFWTQLPAPSPMITAWLGGPAAARYQNWPDAAFVTEALTNLASMFQIPLPDLQAILVASVVFNWAADPYARGAYAYATVGADAARAVVAEPVARTLYFAGEGLYAGAEMGTVEAALASGLTVAQQLTGDDTNGKA